MSFKDSAACHNSRIMYLFTCWDLLLCLLQNILVQSSKTLAALSSRVATINRRFVSSNCLSVFVWVAHGDVDLSSLPPDMMDCKSSTPLSTLSLCCRDMVVVVLLAMCVYYYLMPQWFVSPNIISQTQLIVVFFCGHCYIPIQMGQGLNCFWQQKNNSTISHHPAVRMALLCSHPIRKMLLSSWWFIMLLCVVTHLFDEK